MRINNRRLRSLIRSALISESGRPAATPDYVSKSLQGKAMGPGKGSTFGELAMAAVEAGDYRKAANSVMDALWVDDPWPEDEQALEDMLASAQGIEDVAVAGAEWLTQFRSGGYSSEEQKQGHLSKWGPK
jgi:hypothetical protein